MDEPGGKEHWEPKEDDSSREQWTASWFKGWALWLVGLSWNFPSSVKWVHRTSLVTTMVTVGIY